VPAFVAVAEHRSFTRAAASIGVTPAAVSQAVARLEEDLNTKLLDRTTRSVELTGEGRLYLEYCRSALSQIQTGRDVVEQARQATEGEIVVAVPFILGKLIVGMLPDFLERYPRLNVRLAFSDHISRLVEENIDVAVRVGHLSDSTAVAKKLADTEWVLLGSPAYLSARGTPKTPGDLIDHDCVVYRSPRGYEVEWQLLRRPGSTETMTAARRTRLVLDQGSLIPDAIAQGAGIGMVFTFMLGERLKSGEFVPLLDSYMPPRPPIHALVKPGSQNTAKIRVFLDALDQEFRRLTRRFS
jgi:LysR family transcriptional regulator, regulator for bpeEF and oprC